MRFLGGFKNPLLIAVGLLAAEKIGSVAGAYAAGGIKESVGAQVGGNPWFQYGLPAAIAGLGLYVQGGRFAGQWSTPLGQGMAVNGMTHLATTILGPWIAPDSQLAVY